MSQFGIRESRTGDVILKKKRFLFGALLNQLVISSVAVLYVNIKH